MSIKKLQNIFQKLSKNYVIKLIIITVLLLLIAFAMLESKNSEIAFVYNNF